MNLQALVPTSHFHSHDFFLTPSPSRAGAEDAGNEQVETWRLSKSNCSYSEAIRINNPNLLL
jgi:hypothetical protein